MEWVKNMPNDKYATELCNYYYSIKKLYNEKAISLSKADLKNLITFQKGIHKYWSHLDYLLEGKHKKSKNIK